MKRLIFLSKEYFLVFDDYISSFSSAEALKSSIMNVTGPLIRVLGERFSTDIKVAILETLSTFMGKVSFRRWEFQFE
jgi:hypothetical protein